MVGISRQTEISKIQSSWNEGAYAESWGLCILDNVKFQGSKVYLIGNNRLASVHKQQKKGDKDEAPDWSYQEGDQTKVYKPGPDPVKIRIEGFLYPDKDSSGAIVKQLRTKIEELRRICIDKDGLNGASFFTHQLTIPLYKAFYVKIDEYRISTDITKWGFANFELDCYITTKNMDMQGWLYVDNPTKTEVKKEIRNWKDRIKAKVNKIMGPTNNAIGKINQFKSAVEQNIAMVTGLVNDARGWVESVMDLADISGIIKEFSDLIGSLIYAPSALMSKWEDIVDNFKSLKNIYTDNVELWKTLYEGNKNLSGDDIYTVAFNQYNQENAYINVIDEIIGDDEGEEGNNENLQTEEDINNAKNNIDGMFNDLIERYSYSYDDLVALKRTRLTVLNYLNGLKINKTEELLIDQLTPSTVVSYLRYGDLEHSKNISILNKDNLFLKGVIKSA